MKLGISFFIAIVLAISSRLYLITHKKNRLDESFDEALKNSDHK